MSSSLKAEAAPVWQEPPVEPQNELVLHGFDSAPASVEAAITSLRAALPRDWLAAMMRDFGYEPTGRRRVVRSRRSDLRELDLARFLFDRWVFANPNSRIAREFSSLSWGEFDIGVFLTLLTYEEARSGEFVKAWRLRVAADRYRIALETVQNARTTWARCVRLVERGWTVPR